MRALLPAAAMRIAGGETTREHSDFRELIDRACLDVLQPHAALASGITGVRRAAHARHAHNRVFTPQAWTNGIGLARNAHLVAGTGETRFAEFAYAPPQ
jgi:L-alanine-DL-glutamate epimerase-like enolase superfamily enzyme